MLGVGYDGMDFVPELVVVVFYKDLGLFGCTLFRLVVDAVVVVVVVVLVVVIVEDCDADGGLVVMAVVCRLVLVPGTDYQRFHFLALSVEVNWCY